MHIIKIDEKTTVTAETESEIVQALKAGFGNPKLKTKRAVDEAEVHTALPGHPRGQGAGAGLLRLGLRPSQLQVFLPDPARRGGQGGRQLGLEPGLGPRPAPDGSGGQGGGSLTVPSTADSPGGIKLRGFWF